VEEGGYGGRELGRVEAEEVPEAGEGLINLRLLVILAVAEGVEEAGDVGLGGLGSG
jgi:hypothetical protein